MLLPSHQSVFRHEVYRSLKTLEYKYKLLNNEEFVCEGATSLARAVHNMLELIIARFPTLEDSTIKKIPNLFQKIQIWSFHLSNSRLQEVAWSILPSLEELFSQVKEDSQFIITPIWERNYFIHTENVVDTLAFKMIGNLGLFGETLDENKKFLDNFYKNIKCKNIFLMSYPRLKRLSVLHFAILGHEIGHLFFQEWKHNNLNWFYKTNSVEKAIDDHVDEIISKKQERIRQMGLFSDNIKRKLTTDIFTSMDKCLEEICCDIIGSIIFGYTFLFAQYKFSSPLNINQNFINQGYYPWSYRIKFTLDTLKELGHPFDGSDNPIFSNWIKKLNQRFSIIDLNIIKKDKQYKYHEILIKAIINSHKDIISQLNKFVSPIFFSSVYSKDDCLLVKKYLDNGITPNSRIKNNNNGMIYDPIDMRNIIAGTWYHILSANIDYENTELFHRYLHRANMLSLKAIELSKITKDYQTLKAIELSKVTADYQKN